MLTTRIIRKMSSVVQIPPIKKVIVMGGGNTGSGIAQVSAAAGNDVTIVDLSDQKLAESRAHIENSLQRVAMKNFKHKPSEGEEYIYDTLSRLQMTTDTEHAVKDADLIVEATRENERLKKSIFKELDLIAPDKTIFAMNTSSLSIEGIAGSTNREDRFGGIHFFKPVPIMKLVEVIKGPKTSSETYKRLFNWSQSLGKKALHCNDTPGFLVNRLLVPYLMEAIRLYERGEASIQDIDEAMKLGAGYPMGPIELLDYVGLDLVKDIWETYRSKWPDNPLYKNSEVLDKLVAEGKLGVKTGEGFYKYCPKGKKHRDDLYHRK